MFGVYLDDLLGIDRGTVVGLLGIGGVMLVLVLGLREAEDRRYRRRERVPDSVDGVPSGYVGEVDVSDAGAGDGGGGGD